MKEEARGKRGRRGRQSVVAPADMVRDWRSSEEIVAVRATRCILNKWEEEKKKRRLEGGR
jgi:hypothetical protein